MQNMSNHRYTMSGCKFAALRCLNGFFFKNKCDVISTYRIRREPKDHPLPQQNLAREGETDSGSMLFRGEEGYEDFTCHISLALLADLWAETARVRMRSDCRIYGRIEILIGSTPFKQWFWDGMIEIKLRKNLKWACKSRHFQLLLC